MTASCVAITAARLAPIASSQSVKKPSGSSATPSRDNNSYTTIFRTSHTSNSSRMLPGAVGLQEARLGFGHMGDLGGIDALIGGVDQASRFLDAHQDDFGLGEGVGE